MTSPALNFENFIHLARPSTATCTGN